jgi:hypothetical protein
MANLAVAHLAVGKADVLAAGMDQRVGILLEQLIIGGLAREGDGIGVGFGAVAPAVEDDEDEWFIFKGLPKKTTKLPGQGSVRTMGWR